jgi:AcrR family transcriptional regulator
MTQQPELAKVRQHRKGERREGILHAAAELLADRGFHGVGIDEIGAAAGMSGPGVYSHFSSKADVLVAIFDRVAEQLLVGARRTVSEAADDSAALRDLVAGHVDFALDNRWLISVYDQEAHNLPPEERRRIRRQQRLYVEEWVTVVSELHPQRTDGEVRTSVHAAIGLLHSVADYDSGLPADMLRPLLLRMALGALQSA